MASTPPPPPPPPGDDDAATSPPPPPPKTSDVDAEVPHVHTLALHHVTEATRTYPCEACGGELHFDIESQLLKCQHCGNTHELQEDTGTVEEQDLDGAIAAVKAHQRTVKALEGEKEIVCQNCGGHTTFTGTLTADICPYCATPIQRNDVHNAPERLPVDGVIPFQIAEDQANEIIQKWIKSRWFAPNEFKTYGRTGSFKSVYGASFTYDADTSSTYTGQRGDNYTVTVGSGKNRRTETRTRWTPAAGTVANVFDDVLVFANTGFEKKRVRELEPWPTPTSKPYSPEYIAGHLCRTYDKDVADCLPEAKQEMESEIHSTVRRDIGGDKQRINSLRIQWANMTYKHLLLPVWLLTVMYLDKPFQVYINGVTGEVQGSRPYSKVKIAIAVVLALIVVIGILTLLSSANSGGSSP